MISRILIIAALIAIVHGTFCPPNEIFAFFRCSDKCSDLGKGCVPRTFTGFRCICRNGYKRNDQGKCIPKRDCCTKQNEIYSEYGTDRTCDDVSKTGGGYPPTKEGRCICKKDTYRDSNGNCVSESECYPQCDGENEVYKKNCCEKKCNLNGEDPDECTLTSGCMCKDGYVRQEKNGKCVLRKDCQCDGEHECYMASGCEKDCYEHSCSQCPGPAKCYCHEGYRRKDGKCIRKEDCENEYKVIPIKNK